MGRHKKHAPAAERLKCELDSARARRECILDDLHWMNIEIANLEASLEKRYKLDAREANRFSWFQKAHLEIQEWSCGYFSVLPNEILMKIRDYVPIRKFGLALNHELHNFFNDSDHIRDIATCMAKHHPVIRRNFNLWNARIRKHISDVGWICTFSKRKNPMGHYGITSEGDGYVHIKVMRCGKDGRIWTPEYNLWDECPPEIITRLGHNTRLHGGWNSIPENYDNWPASLFGQSQRFNPRFDLAGITRAGVAISFTRCNFDLGSCSVYVPEPNRGDCTLFIRAIKLLKRGRIVVSDEKKKSLKRYHGADNFEQALEMAVEDILGKL